MRDFFISIAIVILVIAISTLGYISYKVIDLQLDLNSLYSGKKIDYFGRKISFNISTPYFSLNGIGVKLHDVEEISDELIAEYKDPVKIIFNPLKFTLTTIFEGKAKVKNISLSPTIDRDVSTSNRMDVSFKFNFSFFQDLFDGHYFRLINHIKKIEFYRNNTNITNPTLKNEVIFVDEGSYLKIIPKFANYYLTFEQMQIFPPSKFAISGNLNVTKSSPYEHIIPPSIFLGPFFNGKQKGQFKIDADLHKPSIKLLINNFETEASKGSFYSEVTASLNQRKIIIIAESDFYLNPFIYNIFKNQSYINLIGSLAKIIKSEDNFLQVKKDSDVDKYIEFLYSKNEIVNNYSDNDKVDNDSHEQTLEFQTFGSDGKEISLFKPENMDILIPSFKIDKDFKFKIEMHIPMENMQEKISPKIVSFILKNGHDTGILSNGDCEYVKDKDFSCKLSFVIKNYEEIVNFFSDYYFRIIKEEINSKYISLYKNYHKNFLKGISRINYSTSSDIILDIDFKSMEYFKISNEDFTQIAKKYVRNLIEEVGEYAITTKDPIKIFHEYLPEINDPAPLVKIMINKGKISDDLWLKLITPKIHDKTN